MKSIMVTPFTERLAYFRELPIVGSSVKVCHQRADERTRRLTATAIDRCSHAVAYALILSGWLSDRKPVSISIVTSELSVLSNDSRGRRVPALWQVTLRPDLLPHGQAASVRRRLDKRCAHRGTSSGRRTQFRQAAFPQIRVSVWSGAGSNRRPSAFQVNRTTARTAPTRSTTPVDCRAELDVRRGTADQRDDRHCVPTAAGASGSGVRSASSRLSREY
jgi:hypothetical protein